MDWQGEAECPSCGGAGGGPLGRAGSAWDTEDYVCPRCKGLGIVGASASTLAAGPASAGRPGIAKAEPGLAREGKRAAGDG